MGKWGFEVTGADRSEPGTKARRVRHPYPEFPARAGAPYELMTTTVLDWPSCWHESQREAVRPA